MTSLQRFRGRVPVVVFVLLLLVCLIALGLACVCSDGHQAQALERAVGSISAAPAVLEIWSFALLALVGATVPRRRRLASSAVSPTALQCLLL